MLLPLSVRDIIMTSHCIYNVTENTNTNFARKFLFKSIHFRLFEVLLKNPYKFWHLISNEYGNPFV